MKKALLIGLAALCLLSLAGMAQAKISDQAGNYGYKFLTVPYGPVSVALANRGVHSADNAMAFIYQPAAACENDQRIISLSHSPWLVDTTANCLAYSYGRKTSHFGIALRNLDYGEIENRDDSGYLIGYYSPLDMDIIANYAYRLSPSVYFGVNAGVLYQKLDTATSLGLHSDFGLSLLPPLKGGKLSIAARNLGNANQTNQETVRFPSSLEADYTQQFALGEQQLSLGVAALKMSDADLKGSISAELDLANILQIRAGYKVNYDAEGLSAGFGVHYRRFGIDYGFADFTRELTDVHSFGLSYRF